MKVIRDMCLWRTMVHFDRVLYVGEVKAATKSTIYFDGGKIPHWQLRRNPSPPNSRIVAW